jgi:hypothetical protein
MLRIRRLNALGFSGQPKSPVSFLAFEAFELEGISLLRLSRDETAKHLGARFTVLRGERS